MSPPTALLVALAVLLVLAAAVALLRRRVRIVSVTGMSMAPTFLPADGLLVRRVAIGAVRAGQVVVRRETGPRRPAGAGGRATWD